MLKIRGDQLQAFGGARSREFAEQLVASLRRRLFEVAGELPVGYVEDVVALSVATCRDNGYDQQATMNAFAESMLKDEGHPMTPARMALKAASVLRDLDARSRYARLQAVRAAMSPPER